MAKKRSLQVKTPGPEGKKPAWISVGIFAAVGLVIGVAWPSLAGIRIGPDVPGAKAPATAAPKTAPTAAPSVAPTSIPLAKTAKPVEKTLDKQTVVVEGGRIARCYKGRKKLKTAEECGVLKVDKTFATRLSNLASCPSALGFAGEMELGFDIKFDQKEIDVVRGEKSDMPATTVRGILACTADYIRDVNPDKIPHKYSRYRVFYKIKFYPPGTALPRKGTDESASDESDNDRGLAAVTWDTALIRDEPQTGKIIARLVRGTRVKILSRRKDWYRVKLRHKEGWVYRGALGL